MGAATDSEPSGGIAARLAADADLAGKMLDSKGRFLKKY
jgi:hypothetical protein